MSDDLRQRIIRTLKAAKGGLKPKELAKKLSVRRPDYPAFRNLVKRLERDGTVLKRRGGRYGLPDGDNEVTGILKVVGTGFGFVSPEGGGEDVYVRSDDMAHAIHNDRVVCRLTRIGTRHARGRIIRVLERGHPVMVGLFRRTAWGCVVMPDNPKIIRQVLIGPDHAGGARDGQKVLVHIDDWTYDHMYGSVKKVLGRPGEPGTEMLGIIYGYGFDPEFPGPVITETGNFPAAPEPDTAGERTDFRNDLVITIDPDDAKDFDDAVSLEMKDDDTFRLGVHIADVSHYVTGNTALDKEALARGNSVYLTGQVIPMLPPALSENLCSLKPWEDRLTMSAVMDIRASDGHITDCRLCRGIINSRARLNYGQAQAILEGREEPPEPAIRGLLESLDRLKKILLVKRLAEGTLDMELPEVAIRLDKKGHPQEIRVKERLGSHRIIEECMLAANQSVARFLRSRKVPFLYRIHEAPDPKALGEYWNLMKILGFPMKQGKKADRNLQLFLDSLEGPVQRLGSELLLRSLKKAAYSVTNKGHFGLGFGCYTHFTSPIRRYADLINHRILGRVLDGEAVDIPALRKELHLAATVVNQREVLSMEAERESVKLMQVIFMERHLGEEFIGTVSGVHKFGVFITLDDILADGMVHVSDLDDDYYEYDERSMSLRGTGRGKTYRPGDRVRIQVVRADRERRRLDFMVTARLKRPGKAKSQ